MNQPSQFVKIALWFREDLRVNDHPGISEVLSYLKSGGISEEILCYFIWDARWALPPQQTTGLDSGAIRQGFEFKGQRVDLRTWLEDQFRQGLIPSDQQRGLPTNDPIGTLLHKRPNLKEALHLEPDQIPRMGPYRSERLAAGLFHLNQNLNELGLKLNLFYGRPLEVLKTLSAKYEFEKIHAQKLYSADEVGLEKNARLFFTESEFLLSSSELIPDFYLETLCNAKIGSFTKFRLQVEKEIKCAAPRAAIKARSPDHKSSEPFDFRDESHPSQMTRFTDGEHFLSWYFGSPTRALNYKETRDALMGFHSSTKFSLFLNFGFLSSLQILARLKAFEEKHGANESTYWIFFELLWREYFRVYAYKHGAKIFKREGPKPLSQGAGSSAIAQSEAKPTLHERELFWRWVLGQTDSPFVNACMNELRTTGWLSNRGRQNAASYLAKTLKVNWVWGAKWFEYCLLDYDACSNWGNWNYLAGVGSDPRDRTFNVDFQASRYDPDGLYRARFSL